MMNNLKWVFQPLSLFALGMLLALNLTIYLFWYIPGYANLNSATNQLGDTEFANNGSIYRSKQRLRNSRDNEGKSNLKVIFMSQIH